MSNTKKTPAPVRRGPQHRQGHGRHREPPRTPGDLVAVPGQAGLRVLAAGALGSAALMSIPAGVASAATAPSPAAAEAGLYAAPPPPPPTPNQQVTQGFADLANMGTGSSPSLASVLGGIGEADSNAAAAEAGLYAAPPAPLTPAQQVAQDFAALAGDGGGSGITFAPGGRVLSFGAQTTAGLTVTIPLSWSALAGSVRPAPTRPRPKPGCTPPRRRRRRNLPPRSVSTRASPP